MLDGSIVARFKTTSAPLIVGVRVCAKPQQKFQVILDASEDLSLSPAAIRSALVISQPGVACTPDLNDASVSGTIAETCSGFLDNVPTTVALSNGLAAPSGRLVAPLAVSFASRDLEDVGGECHRLTVPLPP